MLNECLCPRDPIKSRGGAPRGQVPPPPMMMPRRRLFLSRRSPFLRDGYINSHTVVTRQPCPRHRRILYI